MQNTQFERETAVAKIGDLVWQGEFHDGWCIGPVPNGGYVLSIAMRALAQVLPHADPLTANAYYFAPTHAGLAECRVEILREGKGSSFGMVRVYQDDELKVQVTAALTTMAMMKGETKQLDAAPVIPSVAQCIPVPSPEFVKITQQTEQRLVPGDEGAFLGKPTGEGRMSGWVSLPDTDQVDLFALVMFTDAMPPPVFNVYGALGWVPTIELSVQIRAVPAPGPLQFEFSSRNHINGVTEEDGRLWDSTGKLVAMSRQTAKFRLATR